MGAVMKETGVQMKRILMLSIRTCYRSTCNHPFLVSIVLVLVFLHRSFPSMFSLLLSASPVLVSTAILLGTLLSFGQPNIPEIDKEENKTHEIASLRTGIPRDATVIERDESFVAEKYSGKSSRDVVDKSIEEASSTTDTVSEVDKCYGNFVSALPPVEENSQEIQVEKQVIEEVERELDNAEFNMKTEMDGETLADAVLLGQRYSQIEKAEDENIELPQHDKSPVESIDSRMADHAGSSPRSPWKQGEEEEEEVDDDDASDIGSDRAESSSPDASMADIIPMLDELHPLLDEEAPQPIHMSHDGSDAGSEKSHKSSNGTNESDDDSENQEEEIGDDDDEDEGTRGSKNETCKSAITWTEDDQKNLMDLGTLELERNQRLENLIARRRARRMMTEKNLIDFESADLSFNIAPISTTRRNPFDSPYSNDNIGLPPIPGSAPSVLLPRRNPFDLPYDSSEEKPDLTGDSFQQEFTAFPPKEMFFRRHESFNVGPSLFAPLKQEKQNINLKPYFVPEQTDSEVACYSSFQRQSSELSDSKVSSVPETDSICSAEDSGDKKHSEEDFSIEADMVSDVERPSEHVGHGHGSESSDDEDAMEFGQAQMGVIGCNEVKGKLGDVQRNPELLSSISETKDIASHAEHDSGEIHLNRKGDEGNCSSRSSSASLSEVHERIFHEKGGESSTSLQFKEENIIEERSECYTTFGLVDGSQQKDPVYDLSPQAFQENLSSYVSSNQQKETPEDIAPMLVQRSVPTVHGESEAANQSVDTDASGNCQILTDSSVVDPGDKNETITSGGTERDGLVLPNREFLGDNKNLDSTNTSIVPEFVGGNASINLKPSSDIEAEEEYVMCPGRRYQHQQDEVPSSSFVTDTDAMDHQTVDEDVACWTSSPKNKFAENLILTAPGELPAVVEQVPDSHAIVLPFANESTDVHPLMKGAAIQSEYEQVHSSSSTSSFIMAIDQQSNEELLSRTSDRLSEEITIYELEKLIYQLEEEVSSDKAMAELSSGSNEALPEPSILQVESILKASSTNNSDASDIPLERSVSSNIQSPSTPPEPTSFPSEASQIRSPAILDDSKDDSLDEELENSDHILVQSFNFPTEATSSHICEKDVHEEAEEGIKEIDEKLLMELDTVGDFSVKDLVSNFNEIEHSWLADGEMNSDMPLMTAQSVEDIDLKTEPVLAKAEVEIGGEFETPERGQIKEDINSGMPVLEAQSLEDIDAACRQTNEQEIVNSSVYKAPDAGMIVEETRAECSEDEILHKDSSLAKLKLPVSEDRSVEKDIDLALKQLSDAEGYSIPSSIEYGTNFVESMAKEEKDSDCLLVEQDMKPSSVENVVPEETSSGLHPSEARFPEDDTDPKLAESSSSSSSDSE